MTNRKICIQYKTMDREIVDLYMVIWLARDGDIFIYSTVLHDLRATQRTKCSCDTSTHVHCLIKPTTVILTEYERMGGGEKSLLCIKQAWNVCTRACHTAYCRSVNCLWLRGHGMGADENTILRFIRDAIFLICYLVCLRFHYRNIRRRPRNVVRIWVVLVWLRFHGNRLCEKLRALG